MSKTITDSQEILNCPRCDSESVVKSGFVNNRQRYLCKDCSYYFSVQKSGKRIDNYYVIKALQLYLEGLSLREIERNLGVSHSTISNWIRKYNIKKPDLHAYNPSYRILTFEEMQEYLSDRKNFEDRGMMITELGNKYLVVHWQKMTE